MAKYREKGTNIFFEAVQFDGSVESVVDLMFSEPPTVSLECETGRHVWTGRVLIETPVGFWIVEPGDWIILGGDGCYQPCKDDKFRQAYEEAV